VSTAIQASNTPHWVHYKLLDGSTTPPQEGVIMPPQIKVFEVTAGDVTEEVPEWSQEASDNVMNSVPGRTQQGQDHRPGPDARVVRRRQRQPG
jgi:hypothetical protein